METDAQKFKKTRLIGYVRVENRDDTYSSPQNANIREFADDKNFELVKMEFETSKGSQVMRVGLWKALRWMVCTKCPPKAMPMSDIYQYWYKEAMRPCNCPEPVPADGLLVDSITAICTTPAQGAKFTLDMCACRSHLYVANEGRCLSCCNDQAIKMLGRPG